MRLSNIGEKLGKAMALSPMHNKLNLNVSQLSLSDKSGREIEISQEVANDDEIFKGDTTKAMAMNDPSKLEPLEPKKRDSMPSIGGSP